MKTCENCFWFQLLENFDCFCMEHDCFCDLDDAKNCKDFLEI